MSNVLRIKRRAAGGAAGAPSSLQNGELAYNEVDNILYYGFGTGGAGGSATTIPAIGGSGYVVAQSGNQSIAGTKTVTGTFDFTGGTITVPTQTSGNNTTAAASTAYVVSYAQPITTALTNILAIASNGMLTRTAANTYSARSIAVTNIGRLTISNGDGAAGNPTLDLASGVITTPGAYPKVTVDTYGRVTAGSTLSSGDVTTGLGYTPENPANKGVAGGYASLDGGGKVPIGQLPDTVIGGMNYQGTWNASTNSPTLVSSTGTKGYYYKVSAAGSTSLDGNSNWTVGDLVVFNGTIWDKVEGGTSDVVSVAGKVGVVTLSYSDIASGTVPVASGGTNLTSYAVGDLIQASGSTTLAKLAAVATGNVLISGGVTTVSSWGKVGLTTHVTGTLTVGNGGTGASTLTGYVKGTGTSAMTASASIPNTDITGLGTMSTQAASAVAITGGTIDGVTLDGGTF